jgi:hypothetical protein
MTQIESHTSRKSAIAVVVVGVLTLGAAAAACAAPGGSKHAAPGRHAVAANTRAARPHPRAPTEQRRRAVQPDYITLAPSRSVPIPGTGPNPTGLGPPAAFPDPYRNPQ